MTRRAADPGTPPTPAHCAPRPSAGKALEADPCTAWLAPGATFADLAGPHGQGWHLVEGVLCLIPVEGQAHTALLALPGDLLGLEAATLGRCPYHLRALLPSRLQALAPAADPAQSRARLETMLQQQWRRTVQLADLRTGNVAERVKHLLVLLRNCGDDSVALMPRQRDLAATVDSTPESMSRVMAHLRRMQLITGAAHRRRHRASDALAAAALPAGMTSTRSPAASARS